VKLILYVAILAAILPACSTISVSAPDGYSASYTRIGNQDISGLRFEKSEDGLYRLTLDKQSSDSDVLGLIRQLVMQ
jgi:hypothetical protein